MPHEDAKTEVVQAPRRFQTTDEFACSSFVLWLPFSVRFQTPNHIKWLLTLYKVSMLAESYQSYGDMAIKLRPGSDNQVERLFGKFSETWGSSERKGSEKGHGRMGRGG